MASVLWEDADAGRKALEKALEHAEMSRNMAEAARDAAQQARKEAVRQLIEEQQRRGAAEEQQQTLQAERERLSRVLADESKERQRAQHGAAEASSRAAALQDAADALQVARGEADRRAVELQQALDREQNRAAQLEEQASALQSQVDSLRAEVAVGASARKASEREHSALLRDVSSEREAHTQEVQRIRSGLERELHVERAARRRLELGLEQALKQLSVSEERSTRASAARREAIRELEAVRVDRSALAADCEEARRRAQQADEALQVLQARESNLEAQLAAETQRRTSAEAALRRLEAELFAVHEALRKAAAERDHIQGLYEPEVRRRRALQEALREAEQSRREAKRAWRLAEQHLHDARAAARGSESARLSSALQLVAERSARLLAQQALEEALGSSSSNAAAAPSAAQPVSSSSAGALGDAEGARAVLAADMQREQQALGNCLKGLEDAQHALRRLAGDNERLSSSNAALAADLETERAERRQLEQQPGTATPTREVAAVGIRKPQSSGGSSDTSALPPHKNLHAPADNRGRHEDGPGADAVGDWRVGAAHTPPNVRRPAAGAEWPEDARGLSGLMPQPPGLGYSASKSSAAGASGGLERAGASVAGAAGAAGSGPRRSLELQQRQQQQQQQQHQRFTGHATAEHSSSGLEPPSFETDTDDDQLRCSGSDAACPPMPHGGGGLGAMLQLHQSVDSSVGDGRSDACDSGLAHDHGNGSQGMEQATSTAVNADAGAASAAASARASSTGRLPALLGGWASGSYPPATHDVPGTMPSHMLTRTGDESSGESSPRAGAHGGCGLVIRTTSARTATANVPAGLSTEQQRQQHNCDADATLPVPFWDTRKSFKDSASEQEASM